ncbi:115_t:CDS:2, partial [Scutellospora calospora]
MERGNNDYYHPVEISTYHQKQFFEQEESRQYYHSRISSSHFDCHLNNNFNNQQPQQYSYPSQTQDYHSQLKSTFDDNILSENSQHIPIFQSSSRTQNHHAQIISFKRQMITSPNTPPLTPPRHHRPFKRRSSSTLVIKKSDGAMVSLLNDDDESTLSPTSLLSDDESVFSSVSSCGCSDDGLVSHIHSPQRQQRLPSNPSLTNANVNKRKYICQHPDCGKSFTTRIHTGEKNFSCLMPGCTSKFSRQDNMMQHYRTHLSSKSRRGSKAGIHTPPPPQTSCPDIDEPQSKRVRCTPTPHHSPMTNLPSVRSIFQEPIHLPPINSMMSSSLPHSSSHHHIRSGRIDNINNSVGMTNYVSIM